MKEPKTKRGMRTKGKLLAAAEKVFGDKGYWDSSISQITRKARVGMGTFYIYYSSKYEIFEDLVRKLNHDLRKSISISVSGLKTRKEIESAGFRAFFEFLSQHKSLYRIIRQAEYVDQKLFRWYYNKIAIGYVEGLRKASDSNEIKNLDPEMLSFALMGIADFIGMRYILWEEKLDSKKVDQLMEFIFDGMLSKSSPKKLARVEG
ncbi:MAG: TetR/AcrR family transcriptional regulator [Thermoplasmata archaeon]